jgi:hypothetical protein
MSGGKGGSQSSSVKIPAWLEDAAKQNLARADQVAQIGYTPYYGPDVAAFNPMQQAAFANTGQAANAFGMAGGGMTGMEGMPAPQTFAGGVQGYGSGGLYDQAVAELAARNPGQAQAMQSMFINPQTGAAPAYPFAAGGANAPAQGGKGGAGSVAMGSNSSGSDALGGVSGLGPSAGTGSGGFGFGGYTGIGDMFNGGGPGASGDTFQGGGPVSGYANFRGMEPIGSNSG